MSEYAIILSLMSQPHTKAKSFYSGFEPSPFYHLNNLQKFISTLTLANLQKLLQIHGLIIYLFILMSHLQD